MSSFYSSLDWALSYWAHFTVRLCHICVASSVSDLRTNPNPSMSLSTVSKACRVNSLPINHLHLARLWSPLARLSLLNAYFSKHTVDSAPNVDARKMPHTSL